jgi:hypothetical protein
MLFLVEERPTFSFSTRLLLIIYSTKIRGRKRDRVGERKRSKKMVGAVKQYESINSLSIDKKIFNIIFMFVSLQM